MQLNRLFNFAKPGIFLAFLYLTNRQLYKWSKILSVFYILFAILSVLTCLFVKLQLMPISIFFIRNNLDSNYDKILCEKYSELFSRLSTELRKPRNIAELRYLINEVYGIYAALYISHNVYHVKFSNNLLVFYNTLKQLLSSLTNKHLKLILSDQPLVHLHILDDIQTLVKPAVNTERRDNATFLDPLSGKAHPPADIRRRKTNDENVTPPADTKFPAHDHHPSEVRRDDSGQGDSGKLSSSHLLEGTKGETRTEVENNTINFLSLFHKENRFFISDAVIRTVLIGQMDMSDELNICTKLHSLMMSIKWEGYAESERGIISQFFRSPRYSFGNTTYLRSLMLYEFKGRNCVVNIPRNIYNSSSIDCLFIPNYGLLEYINRRRIPKRTYGTIGKDGIELISMLYGSDVYESLYDENFTEIVVRDPMLVISNPNGASYEFYVISPTNIQSHLKTSRNVLLYNYASVGDSYGNVSVHDLTVNCQSLIKYLVGKFGTKLKLGFHGYSIGGMCSIIMAKYLQDMSTGKRGITGGNTTGGQEVAPSLDTLICHKTFGDLGSLAGHVTGNVLNFLLPLFNLNIALYMDYLDLKCKKKLVFDINDEIIPLKCSLPCCISSCITIAGVAKASSLFVQFKTLAIDLMNKALKNDVRTIQPLKDAVKLIGNHLNSSGQPLINLLLTDAGNYTSEIDIISAREFFTRLCIWGSLPASCIPKKEKAYLNLTHMFDLCHNVNGFNAFKHNYMLYVPQKVAALFHTFFNQSGNKIYTRDSYYFINWNSIATGNAKSAERNIGGDLGDDSQDEIFPGYTGREDDLFSDDMLHSSLDMLDSHSILDDIRRDMRSFEVAGDPTSELQLAWMRLYSLLHLLQCYQLLDLSIGTFNALDLSNTDDFKPACGGAVSIDSALKCAKELIETLLDIVVGARHSLETCPSELESNLGDDHDFNMHKKQIIADVTKFGNVIPTYQGHNVNDDADVLTLLQI